MAAEIKDYYESSFRKGTKVMEEYADGYRLALKSNSLDSIGNTRHRCDTCGTILLNLKSLIDHEISTHQENRGKLHCGDCSQDFISKFELVRHKRLFCETISQTVREKRQELEAERMQEKRERLKRMKKLKPKHLNGGKKRRGDESSSTDEDPPEDSDTDKHQRKLSETNEKQKTIHSFFKRK